jgi:hypothetical protein
MTRTVRALRTHGVLADIGTTTGHSSVHSLFPRYSRLVLRYYTVTLWLCVKVKQLSHPVNMIHSFSSCLGLSMLHHSLYRPGMGYCL